MPRLRTHHLDAQLNFAIFVLGQTIRKVLGGGGGGGGGVGENTKKSQQRGKAKQNYQSKKFQHMQSKR
jgi:hypothetical protein